MRRSILFLHGNADLYGSSRCLLRFCRRWISDGGIATVLLPHEGALSSELSSVGATIVVEPNLAAFTRTDVKTLRAIFGLIKKCVISTRRLKRLLDDMKPDFIISNTSVLLPALLLRLFVRFPHLMFVREFYNEFGILWQVYRLLLIFGADRILCVSNAVAAQFPVSDIILVLHDGFPLDEFQSVPEDRIRAFRHRHHLGDHPLVGLIGRIKMRRKGQEVFVRSVLHLVQKHKTVKFLLIGSPFPGNEWHLERVMQIADECGVMHRVVYTGDVVDIKAAYAALDVVVLASVQPEPFGGVVIEAMLMGKPVVGTSIGGTTEQIQDHVTGLLVPPGNSHAMAKAIDHLLSNPEEAVAMGKAGAHTARSNWSFDLHYSKFLAILDSF